MEKFKRQAGDYDGLWDDPEGAMMWYDDHLEVVKLLQQEIEDLKLFAQSELSRGATYGQKVGYKIGYDNAVLKFSTKH